MIHCTATIVLSAYADSQVANVWFGPGREVFDENVMS